MACRVIWRRRACADIAAVGAHIALDSPANAKKVVAAIQRAASRLVVPPYKRIIPEFQDPDRRETFAYKYRLMYRVEPSYIRTLRVVHGQRLIENVSGSFEEPAQAEYSPA